MVLSASASLGRAEGEHGFIAVNSGVTARSARKQRAEGAATLRAPRCATAARAGKLAGRAGAGMRICVPKVGATKASQQPKGLAKRRRGIRHATAAPPPHGCSTRTVYVTAARRWERTEERGTGSHWSSALSTLSRSRHKPCATWQDCQLSGGHTLPSNSAASSCSQRTSKQQPLWLQRV